MSAHDKREANAAAGLSVARSVARGVLDATAHTPGPWHYFRQGTRHFISQAADYVARSIKSTEGARNHARRRRAE